VRHLALVHYDVEATPRRLLRAQALAAFDGKITVARDFTRLAW
jgi:ribonuclease BN (tRNA processing enzyme)